MKKDKALYIFNEIDKLFPEARIELEYTQEHELLIAIMLSAQTTDVAVNKVTKNLFKDYTSISDYASALVTDLETYLKTIGLYKNKAKNLKKLAEMILTEFDGKIPNKQEQLEQLPGVGRKTANVFLSEYHHVPKIAVDTHVSRVSIRLGFAKKGDTPLVIEKKLMKSFDKNLWIDLHHKFIHFGRYFCKAKKPLCKECPLLDICKMPVL